MASTATAPDVVEPNVTTTAPDQLWAADISHLRSREGFVYRAVVVDAFSRKVVGWAMADHLRTELVLDAVGMAITSRRPAAGPVHHTDRGSPKAPPGRPPTGPRPTACRPRRAALATTTTT